MLFNIYFDLKKSTYIIVALYLLLFFTACNPYQRVQGNKVPYGIISTNGVEIIAEDNSFTLKNGEKWIPPFQTKIAYDIVHFTNYDLTSAYKGALKYGAKKVMVTIPNEKESIYGILLLSKVFDNCTDSTTMHYNISISKKNIEEINSGKTAVLYESYTGCGLWYNRFKNKDHHFEGKPWILWLSKKPFN